LEEADMVQSRYKTGICFDGLRKATKNLNQEISVLSEIGIEHFPNKCLESYGYASQLDDLYVSRIIILKRML
jgi:hypothetical protein